MSEKTQMQQHFERERERLRREDGCLSISTRKVARVTEHLCGFAQTGRRYLNMTADDTE